VDGLHALPTDPEELMRVVTAAFEAGDLRPLLSAVHKDIVWKAASPRTNLFRFGGVHQKREGVLDVTAQIAMDYVFRRFKPREILARGDVVWGLFDVEADFEFQSGKPGPKPVRLEIAIRWRLKDGKIIEHQAFFDTASLLEQRGDADPNILNPGAIHGP
jgi:ketosteroid isomerase-like protein